MTDAVLDASVIAKWLHEEDEGLLGEASSLLAAVEFGALTVLAPPLLALELLNAAARRWLWSEAALLELPSQITDLGIRFMEPSLTNVAQWAARGLTAYDASYVALAEEHAVPLITEDRAILRTAPGLAIALAAF